MGGRLHGPPPPHRNHRPVLLTSRTHPLFFALLAGAVFLIGGVLYGLYGHSLVQSVYEGRSVAFLNPLIEGQREIPLWAYLDRADGIFFLFSFFCGFSILFCFLLKWFPGFLQGKGAWIFSGSIALLILVWSYFRPEFTENELVYLIPVKRVFDPGFLAADWSWSQPNWNRLVFSIVLSPLTLFLSDLTTALIGRIVVWILLLAGLIRLARIIGLKGWEFALGFFLWLFTGQSAVAGEWVFGGVEAKGFSYAFLFLAMANVLEARFLRAGVYAGLSTAFHVLVGGWGGLALLASAPACGFSKRPPLKKIAGFFVAFILLGLPGWVPAALSVWGGAPMERENYLIDVLFRGAHHLDPHTFLSAGSAADLLFYLFGGLVVIFFVLEKQPARFFLFFLGFLAAVFGLGLWARETEWFSFLYLYPFRLSPLFTCLIFFLLAPRLICSVPKPAPAVMRVLTILVFTGLLFQVVRHRMPVNFAKSAADTFAGWKQAAIRAEEDPFQKLSRWIRTHTPEESIFITPPWEYRFWLLTGRAEVVSYKYIPANASNTKWLRRLQDLNGGKAFEKKSGFALNELKENYPLLSETHLLAMKRNYRASYYLTLQERPDLPFPLVYSSADYFLYLLKTS